MPELVTGQPGGGHRTRGSSSRAVPEGSARASVAILLLCVHLSGCFHYVPVIQTALPGGTEVSIGITDRGRVELAPVFGPGIRRVGGELVESTDTSLVLLVNSAQYLDTGLPAPWDGSRMEIAREYVADVNERQFSRARTGLFAGAIAAVAIAVSFIALRGSGGDGPSGRPGNGDGDQQ